MAEHPSGPGQTPEPGLPDPNQAIEALLRQLAPELADAIRLSAIPHYFDADLLGALRGAPEGAGDLLAALQRSGFVTEIAPARFAEESPGDGIQQGRLAGAVDAGDARQLDGGEIHRHRVVVGEEAGQGQFERDHWGKLYRKSLWDG